LDWLNRTIKLASIRSKLYQYISELGPEECLNRIEGRFSQDSIDDIRKRSGVEIDLLLKETGYDINKVLEEKEFEDARVL
jgi:hypothetical protein